MSDNLPDTAPETNRDKKEDTGFELDKIDISAIKDVSTSSPPPKPAAPAKKAPKKKKQAADKPERTGPEPGPPPSAGVSRKVKLAVATASILMVAVTAVFLVFREQIDLQLPFFQSSDGGKPATYISVGPVITSIDSGDLIKMTLDINCAKKSYKKKIAGLDSQIRNRVVWALQTPKAQYYMQSGDYFGLRKYLSASVMEVLPENSVKEIYFSEFLRY